MNKGDSMREEYDIKGLNPRKNPYANKLKNSCKWNENRKIKDLSLTFSQPIYNNCFYFVIS